MCDSVLYISEEAVKELLNWELTFKATEAALKNVALERVVQTPRTFTRMPEKNSVLLSMPGYLRDDNFGALACKLVTSFPNNANLAKPLPTIMGNIFLFDEFTGLLKAIVGGTEITTYRTAAASAVATKYIRVDKSRQETNVLAILGAGTQGRIHAIAFQHFFAFKRVKLWNRSKERATALAQELKLIVGDVLEVCESVEECVVDADVIVTATYSSTPVLKREWVKNGVHINAVGAGINHHSELDEAIYGDCDIYVDHLASAERELSGLVEIGFGFKGEIGQLITGRLETSAPGRITVFQSLGIAAEDCAMARMIYDRYKEQHK